MVGSHNKRLSLFTVCYCYNCSSNIVSNILLSPIQLSNPIHTSFERSRKCDGTTNIYFLLILPTMDSLDHTYYTFFAQSSFSFWSSRLSDPLTFSISLPTLHFALYVHLNNIPPSNQIAPLVPWGLACWFHIYWPVWMTCSAFPLCRVPKLIYLNLIPTVKRTAEPWLCSYGEIRAGP